VIFFEMKYTDRYKISASLEREQEGQEKEGFIIQSASYEVINI
jgi:hypothetical protein